MLGDIQVYDSGAFGYPGSREYNVASGTAATIKAGEPVLKVTGSPYVVAMITNMPITGTTNLVVGIADSTSTDTVAAAGTVKVTKLVPGLSWLISPDDTTAWDTQAEYDALVGSRVLLKLTGTAAAKTATYTILAADGSTSGCVVENLNIVDYPNLVAFSFRAGLSYLT